MNLNLKKCLKDKIYEQELHLSERLPLHYNQPVDIKVQYSVETENDHLLLHLKTSGDINFSCLRCMKEINRQYQNELTIAVTDKEELAEKLMEDYECIVANHYNVNLEDLIIDELHLYGPEKHREGETCVSLEESDEEHSSS